MLRIIFLSCFLIILSCDLPSEANQDCYGEQGGLAYIDDCGICSGGNTELEPNANKDQCGVCFGLNDCDSPQCNDSEAINYYSDADNIDNNLCIYNLCTDYYDSNSDFNCSSSGSSPYQIGEQLSCETLQTEFDICYPEDCGTVSLADFQGKNILIIYEFDW
tara:strand:+ start:1959 stop:2444 length:486 start_codon:yes stop_codon:yes gene_type:complete